MSLALPHLVITPPSREPTPQMHISPADWERYPGITFTFPSDTAREPAREPTRNYRPRLPPYSPPAPPPKRVDLPTPLIPSDRWFISGRARRTRQGWEPVDSDDEECSSPIHDAAEDAFMAYVYETHYDAGRGVKSEYSADPRKLCERSKERSSYDAFAMAYAHMEATQGYMDSWTTPMPITSVSRKWHEHEHERRMARLPPPVRPLDLPGSGGRAPAIERLEGRDADEKRALARAVVRPVEAVRDEARNRRRNSWWVLGRRA